MKTKLAVQVNAVETMHPYIQMKTSKKPAIARGSVLALFMLVAAGHSARADENTLPLAGAWKFRLDAKDVGVAEKWFTQTFEDTVQLPGTTDENHKGIRKDEQCIDRLSRVWYWKGPAWYQRRLTLSDAWAGKRITMFLERTKHTRVWVDGKY
jgi:beta-galactosidase/beta-glucuronidase